MPVHEYITHEAYYFLKNSGYNIPLLEEHLWGVHDGCDVPERSWQTSKITTGAYREDCEDVVFKHGGLLTTNSHFWDADNRGGGQHGSGDFTHTHLHGVGYFKNAYEKAYLYKNGNWYDHDNNPSWIEFYYSGWTYYFMYRGENGLNGLTKFYKDNILWYEKRINVGGGTEWRRRYVVIEEWVKQLIIWEILGRMCHLIQDQTVPAHAHGDVHAEDCYEDWAEVYSNYTQYTRWTCGNFIDPFFNNFGNPVRYIFYIANQLGDHWPSDGSCNISPPEWAGDNGTYNTIYGQGTYPILENWYNQLGTPPNSVDPDVQAGWDLNKAISLTASLMYWFAVDANLQQTHPAPTNFYIVTTPVNRIIYNGQTSRTTAYANGIGLSFDWNQLRCTRPPPNGNWYGYSNPLHGIWYNIVNGNRFEIHNSSFEGQDCSDLLMPVPFYTIYERVRPCTNNGITCIDWIETDFAMAEGPPPGGGCPYLFTTDGNPVFNPENNLLHKAEFEGYGEDITDRYLLRGKPLLLDTTGEVNLTLVIKELNDAVNYYDYIRLIRLQHSINTKIGVTENNDIVQFDSLQVLSTNLATLNGNYITDDIQYGTVGSNIVSGLPNDQMNIHFPSNALNNPAIIMEIGGDNYFPGVHKDYAGHITVNLSDGSIYETNFSRREHFAVNVIQIPTFGPQVTIENASIDFNRDFRIKYVALTNLTSEEIITTELPLYSAKMTTELFEYQLDNELLSKDYSYVTLDSTNGQALHLQFDNSGYDPAIIPDYILEINGTYQRNASKIFTNNNNKNNYNNLPKLFTNYPNPFNPSTKIRFELPYKQNVEIKIFNVLGQEISTLINGELSEGFHEVLFDGSNYASGIYFYTIKTNNYTESKKMLLIK